MKIERPLLLPLAVSFGAHALLLLGFKPAVPVIPLVTEDPPREIALVPVIPPDEEEELVVTDDAKNRPEERPLPVPGLPETIRSVAIDGPVMRPTQPVLTTGQTITTIPVSWSTSDVGIGTKGAPIIAAHLLDNPPNARYRVAPTYPFEAKRSGQAGEVVVEFTVTERGEVISPRVVRSTDAVFEAPTLRAVAKWRFDPGKKDGRPVRFRMMIPIVFNLTE